MGLRATMWIRTWAFNDRNRRKNDFAVSLQTYEEGKRMRPLKQQVAKNCVAIQSCLCAIATCVCDCDMRVRLRHAKYLQRQATVDIFVPLPLGASKSFSLV